MYFFQQKKPHQNKHYIHIANFTRNDLKATLNTCKTYLKYGRKQISYISYFTNKHLYSMNTQFTACGNHIQHFYIVAWLARNGHFQNQVLTALKTIFTVGMREWGWQTLAATGDTVRHEIINQHCTGERCAAQGRKDKERKKERWHLRPGDKSTQVHGI